MMDLSAGNGRMKQHCPKNSVWTVGRFSFRLVARIARSRILANFFVDVLCRRPPSGPIRQNLKQAVQFNIANQRRQIRRHATASNHEEFYKLAASDIAAQTHPLPRRQDLGRDGRAFTHRLPPAISVWDATRRSPIDARHNHAARKSKS
jgi:hypothetical protein